MMHGEGTLYQKDGSYYKGTFASGQMSGHGKQVTVVNGVETEAYEGSFLRGQRHNEGLDHRVGKSDTRLWYNHGRLLRRQVKRACLTPQMHSVLWQVLCRLPHHHALIITVSTSSRPNQPPGAGFRCSPFLANWTTAPFSSLFMISSSSLQAARFNFPSHAHARFNRWIRNRARALSHGRTGHFEEHPSGVC
jgi:hypothetical protein